MCSKAQKASTRPEISHRQAHCRFARRQAQCLRSCRRMNSRFRLRRVTRRPCRARCPTEGSPSSRSRLEDVLPHTGAGSREGSLCSSSTSQTASTPTTVRLLTPPPSLLLLGRAGTASVEIRAVAAGDVDINTAQRRGSVVRCARVEGLIERVPQPDDLSRPNLERRVSGTASSCAIFVERCSRYVIGMGVRTPDDG